MPIIGITASSRGDAGVYLLNQTGNNTDSNIGNGITATSAGDIYFSGYENNSPNAVLVKFDKNGAITWQKRFSGITIYGFNVALDSSENPYQLGRNQSLPGSGTGAMVTKFNSSGTSQWQRALYDSSDAINPVELRISSSDNIHYSAYVQGANPVATLFAKYNSSGTIQWQRKLTFASGIIGYAMAIDSSENFYSAGEYGANGMVVKYDSSGTLQWQRQLTGSSILPYEAVATSSNVYITGWATVGGVVASLIMKIDSSGSTVWSRTLGFTGDTYGNSIALDSSENVYITGPFNNGTNNDIFLAKYNSSGTIQWQRKISTTGTDTVGGNGISIIGDKIYLAGTTNVSSNNKFFMAVLPTNGSKTGTYTVGSNSFTYAASTLTDASISFTNAAASATASTPTYTDASRSETIVSSSYTANTTII